MREIVFRAYDKTMKRYKPFDGEHDTMLISRDGKIDYYNLQNGSGFDEYILEQFTGIHDATKWEDLTDAERDEWIKAGHTKEDWKGRRVFEGDILQWVDEDNTCEGAKLIFIVKFDGEYEGFFGEGESDNIEPWQFRNHEVIGNIHDNPELLEA